MSAIQDAKGILADAEKLLRDLMHQQLKSQNYGELGELAKLADGLARLASERHQPLASTTPPETRVSVPKARALGSTVTRRATGKKQSYPRFARDGEKLIKVGWSKKAREEYEHRAPKQAVLAFTMHVGRSIRSKSTFAIDDLLPVYDSSGEELPSYQVYLALAWLRSSKAIEKRGRDGYVLTHDALDGSAFDVFWSETPERQ